MNRPRKSAAAFASNPAWPWLEIASKTFEISTAAPQVIAMRLARMAASGLAPDASDRREMHRMGAEKVAAFTRGGLAAGAELMPWALRMSQQSMASWWAWSTIGMRLAATAGRGGALEIPLALAKASRSLPAASRASARATHAAIRPVHATVTANVKRLSRR